MPFDSGKPFPAGNRGRRTLVGVVCLLLTVVMSAHAQQSGGVRGQVLDPSGAVIATATVTAIPEAPTTTATPQPAALSVVDQAGKFVLMGLRPGFYRLEVQAQGFRPLLKTHVQIKPGVVHAMNLRLTLATQQQQLQVSAENGGASVAPENNASAVVISGKNLNALSNDPDQLLSELQQLAGPSVGSKGATIYVDGFTRGDMPPKEAIREIRVNENPFSAAFQELGYGRIEIMTKPGYAAYHGGFSLQGNTKALNAQSPFLTGATVPGYHTLLYSGRFGGPLGAKTSFFLAGQHRDIAHNSTINAEVLNPAFAPVPFIAAISSPRGLNSLSARLDRQISANNTLSARYEYFGIHARNQGIGGQTLASQAYTALRGHHNLQVSDTQVLSPAMVNETRFEFVAISNQQSPLSTAPALQVLGAFTAGGSDSGTWRRKEYHDQFANRTIVDLGRHSLQFGAGVRDVLRGEDSSANFNGRFIFNTLTDYQRTQQDLAQGMSMAAIRASGTGPSQFDLTAGNPHAHVNRLNADLFFQDDWKVRPNLTASYGLRLETENVISDHADWAPRAGLSWGVGRGPTVKTVVRAGFGVFYERFDDDQMIQAAHLNGINSLSFVVANPDFYPSFPSPAALADSGVVAPTRYRIASNLQSPYELESAMSVERQLARNVNVSLTYLNTRGNRQLLTNDVNAPLPGTYDPRLPTTGTRPFGAAQGNIYEYQSTGVFRQNQLIANFNVRGSRLSTFGYYELNDAHSNTAGADSFSMNPWNLAADYGRAGYDARQRLFVGGSVSLPWAVQLFPMLVVRSGQPFSVSLGQDLYGTGIHNGRPGVVTSTTPAADIVVTPYGRFNLHPGPNDAIIAPNLATGPSAFVINLRASRTFGFGSETKGRRGGGGGGGGGGGHHDEDRGSLGTRGLASEGDGFSGGGTNHRYALNVSISARNLLNHVNLGSPVGNLNSPRFGQVLGLAGEPFSGENGVNRRIDLSLELSF
ncbi:MAG: TonB-dependent receptor [Terriglobales bacterium]